MTDRASLSDLASSQNPELRASAARLLAKQRVKVTIDDLQKAGRLREMVFDGTMPADVRSSAARWLSARGLSLRDPAPSAKSAALAERIVDVAKRARRESWTKDRIAAEVRKAIDRAIPKRVSATFGSAPQIRTHNHEEKS